MARKILPYLALVTLASAGCGGGGLNFWLYPEPHLPDQEEALFVAYESHQLQAMDGEDMALKCWGGPREPQAYSRKDVMCRLHIQPGEHTVVFYPAEGSRERVSLTFTAESGKTYGLDRSACTSSAQARMQTCRVEVREVEDRTGGG